MIITRLVQFKNIVVTVFNSLAFQQSWRINFAPFMSTTPKKGIAILGSTGSIGTQTLQVIAEQSEHFLVEVLTAGRNAELLIQQALKFRPNAVVIADESRYAEVWDALDPQDIKVYAGMDAMNQVVEMEGVDTVVTAMVGYAGLRPTLAAIRAGKHIALANKETLVVAGELVMKEAKHFGSMILPVDSEHSAIFQCLVGERLTEVEKIYLTASGGPFRGKKREELSGIGPAQALKHPNWDMGAKITIDSATLMNKGLEAIEAKWLFGLNVDQVDIVVHPTSIVHSFVEFVDGSLKAQLGDPDMMLPIQYALGFPKRLKTERKRFDFGDQLSLNFERPDTTTFRNLALALEAMRSGGNAPCVLNAANEVVVAAFLQEKVGFLEMSDNIEECLQRVAHVAKPTLTELEETDRETRRISKEILA